jgi:phosphoglycolate phosphatase
MNNNQKGMIIWDWNGTLFDDVDICMESMNVLLTKRSLPLLTHELYKEVFTFPVSDYYQRIGFNFKKELFDDVAIEFIDAYRNRVRSATTFPFVNTILLAFKNAGYRQFLISATEHDFLTETLIATDIIHYFEAFSGITDHFAHSKLEMANRFFRENRINISEAYFIGDTNHDFEVAESLGIKCILIADGHQSKERLIETGTKVINELSELSDHFQLAHGGFWVANELLNAKD